MQRTEDNIPRRPGATSMALYDALDFFGAGGNFQS